MMPRRPRHRGLLLALALLTRLPVRLNPPPEEPEHGAAVAAYPLVGLLIGALLVGLAVLAFRFGVPHGPLALLLLVFWVGLTGALHLDGLADSADAWLGGQGERERTLRIMKDPACGPAGVVALVLVLLAKWVALTELLDLGALTALGLAPLLGRAAAAWLFTALPYAREQGLGSAGARHLSRAAVAVSVTLAALAAPLLAAGTGVAMLLTAALVCLFGARLMHRRLGGFTGDTAGALVETVEAAVLFAALLCAV
jgi:adenosylcobinamide-GDP ribazoletransferase